MMIMTVIIILGELHGKEKISGVVLASVISKNILAVYESFKNLKKILNVIFTYFILNYTNWTEIKSKTYFELQI